MGLARAHDQDGDPEAFWSAPVSVAIGETDMQLQQSRLAAGLGHPLRFASTSCWRPARRRRDRRRGKDRDRAGHRSYQTNQQRAFRGGADHAGKGAGRPSRQYRHRGRARRAATARHPDGLVQPGRRGRSGGTGQDRCWSARCAPSRIPFRCSRPIAASSTRPTISPTAWWLAPER